MRAFYSPRGTPYTKLSTSAVQRNIKHENISIEHNQNKCEWIHRILEKLNVFIIPLAAYHQQYPLLNAKFFNAKLEIIHSGIQSISSRINEYLLEQINNPLHAKLDVIQISAQLKVFEDVLNYFSKKLQSEVNTPKSNASDEKNCNYKFLLGHIYETMKLIKNSQNPVLQADSQQINKHFSINFTY